MVLLFFSFFHRCPTHKPKDRNGLRGQGCVVDPEICQTANQTKLRGVQSPVQQKRQDVHLRRSGSAGALRAAAPARRLLQPRAHFLNSLPRVFQDCAQAVARIRRVKPVLIADPALQIPRANWVPGLGRQRVGCCSSLSLTCLGFRAKAQLRVGGYSRVPPKSSPRAAWRPGTSRRRPS